MYTTHTGAGVAPGEPSLGIKGSVPLDPTEHLLYEDTLPSPGNGAALLNTQKQKQGGCQNEETKKRGPNERTDQNSRKRTTQNEDKPLDLLDPGFKTLVIRMLKELRGRVDELRENFN